MKFSASAVVLALATAASAQQLDPCINKSIIGAGCAGTTDLKCICKGSATGTFLTDVLTQLVQYCPKTVDPSSLFSTLTSACKGAGIEIPAQNIADAQQLAGSVFGGSAGGASGASSTAAPTAHGSVGAPVQASATTKPSSANAGSPTAIGDSTAVISVPTGSADAGASNGSLITAPTATPKPNASSSADASSASGFATSSSHAASASNTAAAGSNGQNAGVRTGASMGAAVLGLAAAVMM